MREHFRQFTERGFRISVALEENIEWSKEAVPGNTHS